MPFDEMLKNIKETRERLPEIFQDAVLSSADEITRLNRANLRAGKLSTGDNITPDYSPRTAKKKGKSTPDLLDTGGFHESIYLTETNRPGEVVVASDEMRDGKPLAAELENKYSSDIYGVQDEQLDRIFDGSAGSEIIKNIEDNGFKT